MMNQKHNQSGQAIIILLMIMLVALTIGLGVISRSNTSVSSSSQHEESSRAYTAAQAGLEKAEEESPVNGAGPSSYDLDLGNQSSAKVTVSPDLPSPRQALEYPPIGKDTNAQFWLEDPNNLTSQDYPEDTGFSVYFGNMPPVNGDKPALELTVVYQDDSTGDYLLKKYFEDSDNSGARFSNGFDHGSLISCDGSAGKPIPTSNIPNPPGSLFYCQVDITGVVLPGPGTRLKPIMVRARILYSSTPQKLALAPATGESLPPQAKIYTSIGTSALTQQQLQTFRLPKVVPAYFDFAIFAAADIDK